MEYSTRLRRLLVALAIIAAFIFMTGSTADSAAVQVQKRSIVRRENANTNSVATVERCGTNAVCGWEVYNPSTRVRQYYIASPCKCTPKDTCIRVEDDIDVPAYVYRCREVRGRHNKTTIRPTTDTTAGTY